MQPKRKTRQQRQSEKTLSTQSQSKSHQTLESDLKNASVRDLLAKMNPALTKETVDEMQKGTIGQKLSDIQKQFRERFIDKELTPDVLPELQKQYDQLKKSVEIQPVEPIHEESKSSVHNDLRESLKTHVSKKIQSQFNDLRNDDDVKSMVDYLSKTQRGQAKLEKSIEEVVDMHRVDITQMLSEPFEVQSDTRTEKTFIPQRQEQFHNITVEELIKEQPLPQAVKEKALSVYSRLVDHEKRYAKTEYEMDQRKIDLRQNDNDAPEVEAQVDLQQAEPIFDIDRNNEIDAVDVIQHLNGFFDVALELGQEANNVHLDAEQLELFKSEMTNEDAILNDFAYFKKTGMLKNKKDPKYEKSKSVFNEQIIKMLAEQGKQISYIGASTQKENTAQQFAVDKARVDQLKQNEINQKLAQNPNADLNKLHRELDLKYKPEKELNLLSKNGKLSLDELSDFIIKAFGFVSKISGDINPQAGLQQYAQVTNIFNPKIQKKETNQFNLNSGQAFKIREC